MKVVVALIMCALLAVHGAHAQFGRGNESDIFALENKLQVVRYICRTLEVKECSCL